MFGNSFGSGYPSAPSGFGAPAPQPLLSQPQPSFGGFNAAPRNTFAPVSTNFGGFGSQPSAAQPAPYGQAAFGQQQQPSAFGQQQPSAFGQTATGFGSPATATSAAFGTMQPSTGYGSSQPMTSFGSPMGGFGSTQPSGFGANTFGSPPQGAPASGFGSFQTIGGGATGTASQFGAPSMNTFGNPGAYGQPSSTTASSNVGINGAHNPQHDGELEPAQRPSDTITAVRFTPQANAAQTMAVSSWDGGLRLYDVVPNGSQYKPMAKAMTQLSGPVLDCAYRSDGNAIFAAGLDGTVSLWDIQSGATQAVPIGKHDRTCKSLAWIPEINLLVSAGWDNSLRYWDARQPQPAMVVPLPEKANALGVRHPILVVACSSVTQGPQYDYPVVVYHLGQPQTPMRQHRVSDKTSLLKMSGRSVAVSTDRSFYALTGVEGRVSIQHVDSAKKSADFTFRCHRDANTNAKAYNPVHQIDFHPTNNTFATCGGDGTFSFWDKDLKQRLKHLARPCLFPDQRPAPVVACQFNATGNVFAYAVGYDWSMGSARNNPASQVNTVMLYPVQQADIVSKGAASGLRR